MHAFLANVLPDTGYYRLVLLDGKPRTLWASTVGELADLAARHADHANVYFGTASYATDGSGHANNVQANRALRLDIDAGQDKFDRHGGEGVYQTQRHALQAVTDFIRATGLMPSYVVSSGQGLHVYYVLPHALPPAEWTVLAERLKLLAEQHNLLADPAVTADVTRLLRVPGTLHKSGARCAVLAGQGRPVDMAALDAALPRAPTYSADDLAMNDALLADLRPEREHPPASAFKIVQHCAALRLVADTRGDVAEPLWRAMLGVVKHTVEGDEQAHDWSTGYEGYSHRETQRKLDAWRTGPTTCAEFAKHCTQCSSCPHRGRITSPIQLGALSDPEQAALPPEQQTTLAPPPEPAPTGDAWDGMLPPGAKVERTETGGHMLSWRLQRTGKDPDGNPVTTNTWVPVTPTVFWFSRWGEAQNHTDNAQVALCMWTGTHVARYDLDQTALSSPAKLIEALAAKAIHTTIHPEAAKAAHLYAKSQYMFIQNQHQDLRVTDRFGMRITDGGELVAVHGRYTIYGDGHIRDTLLGPALRLAAQDYPLPLPPAEPGRETWGPAVWDTHILPAARRHVDFLKKFYGSEALQPYQLAIMLAVASPLMAFATGNYRGPGDLPEQSTLSVSLYSRDGGYGKTTACQAGVMAYGSPSALARGQGEAASTALARMARLSQAGTMPNVMDEMGGLTAPALFTLLSNTANGSARGRLRQDGSLVRSAPWALINLLTTNRSLQEILQSNEGGATDAVQRRILEINVGGLTRPDRDQRAEFTEAFGTLSYECAGALGAVVERELARLGPDGANRLMLKWVTQADRLSDGSMADRFFYRAFGAVLAVCSLLKPIDLLPFSVADLVRQFKLALENTQRMIAMSAQTNDPLEQLSQCLHELAPYTLVTVGEVLRTGNSYDVMLNERMPDRVLARHVQSTHKTYLATQALRDWAQSKRLSEAEITMAARRTGILVAYERKSAKGFSRRKNLLKGMRTETDLTTNVYTINLRALRQYLGGEAPDEDGQTAEVLDIQTGKPVEPAASKPTGSDA